MGGEPITEYPAVVLLDLGGSLCTGTVVSKRVILTAAHCLSGSPTSIRALFVNAMGESGTAIVAATYENKAGADIGAIALSEDAPVEPIPANPHALDPHIGDDIMIIGFGVTGENSSDSGVKRMGMARLDGLTGPDVELGEMTTTNDPQGTCYGDSGGPNFITIDGTNFVAGVTSRGTDVCGAGLDIAVRADSHIDWLNAFIDENDPATCAADGRCAEGCADLDVDCCVSDGECVEECGTSDIDCSDDGTGAGNGSGGQSTEPGANATGACSAGGEGSNHPVAILLLGLGLIGFLRRRAA